LTRQRDQINHVTVFYTEGIAFSICHVLMNQSRNNAVFVLSPPLQSVTGARLIVGPHPSQPPSGLYIFIIIFLRLFNITMSVDFEQKHLPCKMWFS